MAYPIVLLCGRKNTGKDTAANFIVEEMQGSIVSLATPLKAFVGTIFDIPQDNLFGASELREVPCAVNWTNVWSNLRYWFTDYLREWDLFENTDRYRNSMSDLFKFLEDGNPKTVTPRLLLQQIGTTWGRKVDPYLWAKIALKTAEEELIHGRHIVVIPDGRFPNEATTVKRVGGVVIKVINPKDKYVPISDTHVSEVGLDLYPHWWYDALFFNDKTLGLDALKYGIQQSMLSLYPNPKLAFTAAPPFQSIPPPEPESDDD